jgi:hypothetical protein
VRNEEQALVEGCGHEEGTEVHAEVTKFAEKRRGMKKGTGVDAINGRSTIARNWKVRLKSKALHERSIRESRSIL